MLADGGAYGFAARGYDRSRPLVIDPSLAYSAYLGGTNADLSRAIAVDSQGAAYVVGDAASADFPTVAGSFDTSASGNGDAFVSKVNASGSALVCSTYLGGSSADQGHGIAVDSLGAAYVTGRTASTNFPTTAGAFDTTQNGGNDGFVTKLNASGSALTYSTYLGGTTVAGAPGSFEQGERIAVDSLGPRTS